MVKHKVPGKQVGIVILVIVSLFAQLIPATSFPVFAQEKKCGEEALNSVIRTAAVTDADLVLEVPDETVDLAVYTANWRFRLKDATLVEGLVYDLFLLHSDMLTGTDLNAAFATYKQIYQPVLETLSESQDTDQHDWIIHTMLNVALDIPELAPEVPHVWKELLQHGASESSLDSDYQIGRSAQRYNLTDQLLNRSTDIMARVYACAKEIPAVAEAHDQHYSHQLVSSIIDRFDKILADNPDLPIPIALLDNIGDDGTLNVSLNDLKAMSEAEFEKLNASIDSIQESLIEIDKQQDVIIDFLKDQELKAKWQEVMKKKAAEQQRIIDGVKTGISVLSSLIGHYDPELAKQVNVVGNSALQVGVALNNWLNATAGLNGLDKIGSFSTLVMTGNVIGAVMNVVSLFGDAQPTPEELILAEIGKLRQQVDQLRTEMHSRFDRIDQELNAIYSSMHDRFNQIDIQLGKINGNILEVQHGLLAIDLQLSRIEHNNYEFLDALGRRPLLEAINGGLGYEERTGSPMPYQPDFVGFENVLHSWATVHAFDPLNAGPVERDFSDAQVLAQLNAYPLDSNINYLNGWLAVHDLPTLTNERLASPRDWLFASRAYAQLGIEWPEHMGRINVQRQDALDQVGVDLETALHRISTVETPSGPQGNHLLFTTVISNYQNHLETLDTSIQGIETGFMTEVQNNLRPGLPFDLYGGVAQTVTFATEGFTKLDYGNPVYTLEAPSNLPIPNYNEYNLADYFRLFETERSHLTLDAEFVFPASVAASPDLPPPPPPCPPTCPAITVDLLIRVSVLYSDVAILNMEMNAGTLSVELGTDAKEYTVANWGTLKPRFEQEAFTVAPSPDLAQQRTDILNVVTTKLQERLATYQQALYGQVFNELSIGSLRTQATQAGGGKALIDSFVILGLPRALAEDEFFHAMLFGNQQLVDDSELIQSYAISATELITAVNVLVNPRLVVKQTAEERRTAFVAMLNQYLDAITAGTHVEGPDYIANTRAVFNLTMRIAHFIAPPENPGEGATVSGMLFNDVNDNGSRDSSEVPIAGATVTLNAATVSVAAARTSVTNAEGVYTFTNVPNGSYTLQATLPSGQHSAPITITVSGNGNVAVPAMPVQVGSDLYLPALERG